MNYTCPSCGKRYDIRDDFIKPGGMKLRCRQCKSIMIIKPPGEQGGPPPVPPGSAKVPLSVPPAPREAAMSLPPSPAARKGPSSDLPVAARTAEHDLVGEFDLVDPAATPARGVSALPDPGSSKGPSLPAVASDKPDLQVSRSGNLGQLDDAFELVEPGGLLGEQDSGDDLLAPARADSDGGALDFDLDLPSPAIPTPAPMASDPGKGEEIGPRARSRGGQGIQRTIAGMPSPLVTPMPEGGPGAEVSSRFQTGPVSKKAATVMGMPAFKPPLQAAKQPIGALEDPFGGLDLPAPAAQERGEFDLPRGSAPEARPPALKAGVAPGDDFDVALDPVDGEGRQDHRGAPTPLPPVLTSPRSTPAIASPSLPVPSIRQGMGAVSGAIGLPTAVASAASTEPDPFADLDLPAPRMDIAPQSGTTDDPFADLGVSRTAQADASLPPPEEPQPPTPRKHRPSSGGERDIFAEITDEVVKDGPARAGVASGGAGAPAGSAGIDDLLSGPVSSTSLGTAASTGSVGGVSFGEISLDGSEQAPDAPGGSLDLPERKYGPTPGPDDGLSLDLDALGADAAVRASVPPAPVMEKRKDEAPSRATVKLLAALLVLVALGGCGAALYFTGMYVDIFKFGSKLAGRDIDAMNAEREKLLADVSGSLASDSYASYTEGAGRVEAYSRRSRDELASACFIYLAYSIQMRFGQDDKWDEKAEAHLRQMKLGKDLPREKDLAVSAQKLFHGKDAQNAIRTLDRMGRARPRDAEVAALEGLGALHMGDGKRALQAYRSLEKIEGRSARVLYGMVRALRFLGVNDEADRVLSELLETHPDHMDGKILRGKLLIGLAQLGQADILLNGVLKVSESKMGPGQVSTINALLGRIYLERQDTVKALEQFSIAEKADPNNVEAIMGLATIHLLNGEPVKALGRFKMASAIDPTNLDIQLGIIESHIDLADYGEAKKALDGLLASHPQDHRVHHLLGRLYVALKSLPEAEASFGKAIELNPTYLASYLELAKLFFDTERVSSAMDVLDQAKLKLPPTANLHAAFGQGYIERDDLDGAVKELDAALDADPNHLQAHFLMGVAMYRMAEYETAEQMFTWVEKRNPKHPGLILQQGLLFEAMGDITKAEAYYSKALAEQPDDPEVQIRAASILVTAGKYDEARTLLTKVLEMDAGNPEAMYYMGRIELAEGQPVLALKLINNAIRVRPNVAVYHFYAALAQETNGSFSEALESVDRALTLDDDLAEAYLLRGRLLVRMGAVKDGTEDLLRSLELKPDMVQAYAPLGKAAESLRKWNEAMDYYEKALAADPAVGEIHVDLALIQNEKGDKQEAVQHFEMAVELGRVMETKPKWFFTALYYVGRHEEAKGDKDGALAIYSEYLEIAPLAAIDREDVEKRVEKIKAGF